MATPALGEDLGARDSSNSPPRPPGFPQPHAGDLYLNYDPTAGRSRFVLTCLDFPVAFPSVYYAYSTNSSGSVWNPLLKVMAGSNPISWDFPSIAVGTTGRIVIGASKLDVTKTPNNVGYYTYVSDDGGVHWTGEHRVGNLLGEISRLVASGSGFHAFIVDRTNPNDWQLNRYYSSDGVNWSLAPNQPMSRYVMPLKNSGGKYSNSCPDRNRPCTLSGSPDYYGPIAYAREPDAVGSTGLGWVVAFPVNISGKNAINVSTESGGGETFTHSADLFLHGITTSASGDWWLSYHTYQGAPNPYLPLLVGVVYRTPGSPTYLGAVIEQSIDPKKWWWWKNFGPHCEASCFIAGDYMRPASNVYAGASVPWVKDSTRQTDLKQAFLQDPEGTAPPQFLPHIEPFVEGTDLRDRGVLTSAHVQQIVQEQLSQLPRVSSLYYAGQRLARK